MAAYVNDTGDFMRQAQEITRNVRMWQEKHPISANGRVILGGRGTGRGMPFVEIGIRSRKKNPELMNAFANFARASGATIRMENQQGLKFSFDVRSPSAVLTAYPKKVLGLKTQTAKMLELHLNK